MKLAVKIRRQHPIGRHIVDFAVPARKLAIEIDGGQHASTGAADARRTLQLAVHGYRVIRFWNNDVLGNLDGVLETVRSEVGAPASPGSLCSPPSPP